jgi:beta propeller repeat protein
MKPGIAAWLLVALSSLTTLACCSGCGDGGSGDADGSTDADGDSDADADTDTDTDTDEVFDWQPLPEGYDCGPGCRQITFESIHSMAGMSTDGRYFTCATEANPDNNGIIVDIEKECWTYTFHPDPELEETLWSCSCVVEGEAIFKTFDMINDYLSITTLTFFDIENGTGQVLQKMEENPEAGGRYYKQMGFNDNYVAYEIMHFGNSGQVFLMDRGTEETTPISDDGITPFRTRMDGDYIVWKQGLDNKEIYAHQISTSTTWNLTDHPADQFWPQIDGTRVVWMDLRNGSDEDSYENADIYMYDFADDSLTRITEGEWVKVAPDISGDRIVWQDHRACQYPNEVQDFSEVDIWMHDLATGQDHQITSFEGGESRCLIAGGKVFFYMRVPEQPLLALFVQELSALGL